MRLRVRSLIVRRMMGHAVNLGRRNVPHGAVERTYSAPWARRRTASAAAAAAARADGTLRTMSVFVARFRQAGLHRPRLLAAAALGVAAFFLLPSAWTFTARVLVAWN